MRRAYRLQACDSDASAVLAGPVPGFALALTRAGSGRYPYWASMCTGMPARPLRGQVSCGRCCGFRARQACGLRRGPGFRTHTRRLTTVRTFSPKAGDIQRQWHVIDAADVVLGRLASQTAILLRGKHKPIFAPHVDTGDFVIIVNAAKVSLSGNKLQDKKAYRHSGYPGGLRSVSYGELMAKSPERAVEKAVRGMLPKNSL